MSSFVLLDAGHNRLTAGKRSPDNSLLEYEFNFDVACRIREELVRHGVKAEVQQIVIANSTEEMNHRVQLANKLAPDLLVSIHANAFGAGFNDANGWEIYCYKMAGESYRLAAAIKEASIPFLGVRNRGIKDGAHMAMIGRTAMPAVLVEHAFYTNKKECKLLKSEDFRQKCAVADAKGILSYLGIAYRDGAESDREKVRKRFHLEEGTLEYLDDYKYADALYKRLAETE